MKGDASWDKKLHIRTGGRDASMEDAHHRSYEPTPYAVLEKLARSGRITKESVLVDYGCGKGRVSLFLGFMCGCRGIGVDFSPAMCEAARENRLRAAVKADVSFVCEAAERFDVPQDADRFYFFNPFSAETLRPVLARILGSWYLFPRPLLLMFYYPSDEFLGVLAETEELDFLGEIDCSDLFPGSARERILCYGTGDGLFSASENS